MKRWFISLGLCGVLGCSGGITTQPAQPNYALNNVDAACVRGLILNSLVDQGFVVRSSTDSQIVAGRNSIGGALGAIAAPNEERRVTILMIQLPDNGMRVVVSEALVSNAGSGFERPTQVYPGNGLYSMTGQGAQTQCARR